MKSDIQKLFQVSPEKKKFPKFTNFSFKIKKKEEIIAKYRLISIPTSCIYVLTI
jgi:hypothetical protein